METISEELQFSPTEAEIVYIPHVEDDMKPKARQQYEINLDFQQTFKNLGLRGEEETTKEREM